MRLLLDERILADGRVVRTWATTGAPGQLAIANDDGASGALPVAALDRVMARFGKPLADGIELDGDTLELDGGTLRRLRFHAAVDATGRDYLIWERASHEPLCLLATTATAALLHLLRALGSEI
jgi:hypothetical protein